MGGLYGREHIVAEASSLAAEAAHGRGRLLLFSGEPGIGKTRLLEHLTTIAGRNGSTVAWGRAWEAGGAPAYWPWLQIFDALSIEDPFAALGDTTGPGAADARFAAFELAIAGLRQRASQQPLALALDDLHAADPPSLMLLLALTRTLARSPILVLGTYREAELLDNAEIASLLHKLGREAEQFPLPRLSLPELAAWVEEQLPGAGEGTAREVYQVSEGHPLFVVEALRRLRHGVVGSLPRELGTLFDDRLQRLSSRARELLRVAAVLGREFTVDEVAATAAESPDHAVLALRESAAASIVVARGGQGGFAFAHILLRDRLHAELLPSQRAALHFRAGMLQLAAGRDPRSAVFHLFEGQSAGSAEPLVRAALAASRLALARLAFEEARQLAGRALATCAGGELPALLPIELTLVVAEAQMRLGEIHQARELAAQAAEAAASAGAGALLAHAAIVYATELASGVLDRRMIALLRRALGALDEGDTTLRARVLARLSAALTPPEDLNGAHESLTLLRAAVAMAHRLGEPATLMYVCHFATMQRSQISAAEHLGFARQTVELARALEQPLVLVAALPGYLTTLIARGDLACAEAELPQYDELLARFPQPLHQLRRQQVGALIAFLRGAGTEAERCQREAERLAAQSGALGSCHLQRLSFAELRGQPASLEPSIAGIAEYFPGYDAWYRAGLGRPREARAALQHHIRVGSALHELLKEGGQAGGQLLELMGASEAAARLRDVELGELLYATLNQDHYADWDFLPLGPGVVLGPVQRVLGDLAKAIGRSADAVGHHAAARALYEKLGARWLADSCLPPPAASPEPEVARADQPGARAGARSFASPPAELQLAREGEVWAIRTPAGGTVRLKHSKGLSHLSYLVERPGREIHVIEICAVEHPTGDAGPVLDARARAEYAVRLRELQEALTDAEGVGQPDRALHIREEMEALAEQLAAAVGLGGRDRRAASEIERLRVNVQRRLKDVIVRASAVDGELGRYLSLTLSTGNFCCFRPL